MLTELPLFAGATFEPKKDAGRLKRQLDDVRSVMLGGGWHTLEQLSAQTGHPQTSISARLRDLRKLKHGAYNIERKRVPGHKGLYEYHLGSISRG